MITKVNIDPFKLDDLDEGLYSGNLDDTEDIVIDFDLRAAARYIKENNLTEVTEEIKEMFKK